MCGADDRQNAFFCSFEQFKNIYQLEVRRAPRVGGCLHIAMLTVRESDGTALSTKIRDVVLEQGQQTIVQNLRQSDVVARYGQCQFVIMLPFANLEDSTIVMKRIVRAYCDQHPKSVILMNYQIREMELV